MAPNYYPDFAITWRKVFENYCNCEQTDQANRAMQMCFFSEAFPVNDTEMYEETKLGSVIAQEQAYV